MWKALVVVFPSLGLVPGTFHLFTVFVHLHPSMGELKCLSLPYTIREGEKEEEEEGEEEEEKEERMAIVAPLRLTDALADARFLTTADAETTTRRRRIDRGLHSYWTG